MNPSNSEQPVLTLAIPNRNGGRFLEDTLVSLERNRPFVRWWLQDSCSEDDSVEIAKRFLSPVDRIQVERDTSQTNGLNRAINSMGGKIIGFLNSDDCLADGAAEAVLSAFAADPQLDLVYGEVEWIDAKGVSEGFHRGDISSLEDVLDIYRVWWKEKQWVQPEVFWRRSLWDRVGPLNENYNLAFDYEYWVRCFERGVKVQRLPRVLARFRRHAGQKSTASRQAAEEIRSIVSRSLASNSLAGTRDGSILRRRLAYDNYRADPQGQEFWRVLMRNPSWLALPEVRRRLGKSKMGRALAGKPRNS
jgi:glycosyltransferase involved in cell wall biosynthesis